MDRIRCETCGSNDIKKIDDDLFVCQSCGIQYSRSSIQKMLGTVTIDHTSEVENTLKRAEQFEAGGDMDTAKEYYNKALDMDAENQKAFERLSEINAKQSFDGYYVVKSTLSQEEVIDHFVKELSMTKSIACDIYKELKITSVTTEYNAFVFEKATFKHEWSAVQLKNYYENQTVYETTYENGRPVQKPQTKRVKKTNRIQRSGTNIHTSSALYHASNTALKRMNVGLKNDEKILAEMVASALYDKWDLYKPKKLKPNDVILSENGASYDGIALNLNLDVNICKNKSAALRERGDQEAVQEIIPQIGGDGYENLNAMYEIVEHDTTCIAFPITVIRYTYKEKEYVAVCDNVKHTLTMPKMYPCDKEIANARSSIQVDRLGVDIVRSIGYKISGILFAIGVLAFILAVVFDSDFFGTIAGITLLGSIAAFVYFTIKDSKNSDKIDKQSDDLRTQLFTPRARAFVQCHTAFFEKYNQSHAVEEAVDAARGISTPDVEVQYSIAGNGEFKTVTYLEVEEIEKEAQSAHERPNPLSSDAKKEVTMLRLKKALWITGFVVACIIVVIIAICLFGLEEMEGFGETIFFLVLAGICGVPYYFVLSPRLEKLNQRIEEIEGKPQAPVNIDKDRWIS